MTASTPVFRRLDSPPAIFVSRAAVRHTFQGWMQVQVAISDGRGVTSWPLPVAKRWLTGTNAPIVRIGMGRNPRKRSSRDQQLVPNLLTCQELVTAKLTGTKLS